jgi:MFS family permease
MNVRRLFVASCLSLLTTSMVFAIRGDIEADLSSAFHLTKEQMGLIWGPAFWGFTLAIFASGLIVDAVGMRALHVVSSLGYIGGILIVLLAPRPQGPVSSIFASSGTLLLYAGFLAMGLSQGLVEGVINPLVATIFSENKTHKLNVLHAWWPGGMVVGGLAAVLLTRLGASWQVKLASILVPAAVYLLLILGQHYPKTERVQSNVGTGEMFKEVMNPMFLLLFACMWMTAASELGPDQWFPSIMKELTGLQGVWFLMYTAGLMFVLRFFFGGIGHKLSPFGLLMGCSILCAVGLYWLGGLRAGSSTVVAFVAATLFGVGKTYYWPTMLGVTSELFPKGGALLLALMGGAGMLCIAVVLPIMGARFDQAGAGAALRAVAVLPVILTVVFGLLFLYYKARGGYRAVKLSASSAA